MKTAQVFSLREANEERRQRRQHNIEVGKTVNSLLHQWLDDVESSRSGKIEVPIKKLQQQAEEDGDEVFSEAVGKAAEELFGWFFNHGITTLGMSQCLRSGMIVIWQKNRRKS